MSAGYWRCSGCWSLVPSVGDGTICGLCGAWVEPAPRPKPWPRPIASVEGMMARRAALMPMVEGLMRVYVAAMTRAALGEGSREEAVLAYEAASYVTFALGYEVDELDELEAMVTPAMREAARQIGAPYTPPAQRGEAVTWARVAALLRGAGEG